MWIRESILVIFVNVLLKKTLSPVILLAISLWLKEVDDSSWNRLLNVIKYFNNTDLIFNYIYKEFIRCTSMKCGFHSKQLRLLIIFGDYIIFSNGKLSWWVNKFLWIFLCLYFTFVSSMEPWFFQAFIFRFLHAKLVKKWIGGGGANFGNSLLQKDSKLKLTSCFFYTKRIHVEFSILTEKLLFSTLM